MISVNSMSPARLYSAAAEKLAPHRLTLLFGLAVLGAAGAVYYVYRRLNPSVHDLFEKGEYKKVVQYCGEEFSRLDRIKAPLDSTLNIAPYFWRNAADLKIGEFHRVIDSCRNVTKCKMNDQLKAQFILQEMEARLSLNQLAEATQTFEKNKDLLTKQSKLLGQAHYLRALAYKLARDNSSAVYCCDQALEQIPAQDVELKVKVLALKVLDLLNMNKFPEAAEAANSALKLHLTSTGKVSKETLVVLYFSLALSEYAQQKYRQGLSDFETALRNIEENDQYLRNLLTFQGSYLRAAFAQFYTDGQTTLRETEEAYQACQGASDDYRSRSELTRCIIKIIASDLSVGSISLSRLATRNRELPRAT